MPGMPASYRGQPARVNPLHLVRHPPRTALGRPLQARRMPAPPMDVGPHPPPAAPSYYPIELQPAIATQPISYTTTSYTSVPFTTMPSAHPTIVSPAPIATIHGAGGCGPPTTHDPTGGGGET